MKKTTIFLASLFVFCNIAKAQIWIPSADFQSYKTLHLNLDTYDSTAKESDGTRKGVLHSVGMVAGVLPCDKIQAEAGFNLMYQGTSADDYPLYLQGKIGTPENALFEDSPAVLGGVYNVGFKNDVTNQDIFYGLVAKTFPVVGRFAAGYYTGNDKIFVDENGKKANDGILLSWDRTMKEISDRLWFSADYQSGDSALGALSFGFSWDFSENTSVLLGYDIYNNDKVSGKDTFTVQVDIDFL